MKKIIISITNPGESPADNGRTIHALKLAKGLRAGGAEVLLVFEGQGVTWIDRFVRRSEDSHPFVKHYGPAFDEVRDLARACNMCCIRFDATEAVQAAEIPILGDGREHVDTASYVLDGWHLVTY